MTKDVCFFYILIKSLMTVKINANREKCRLSAYYVFEMKIELHWFNTRQKAARNLTCRFKTPITLREKSARLLRESQHDICPKAFSLTFPFISTTLEKCTMYNSHIRRAAISLDKADYQKINRRIPRFCSTAVP